MFHRVPERWMHRIRWGLTVGWLLLIVSLFFDPITPWLTQAHWAWSPWRIDPNRCVQVQGVCLPQNPYPIAASVFWGIILPLTLLLLLVFGHELWRRICPLSFVSQLPRALGWQRRLRRRDVLFGPKQAVKIRPNSWLGRHHTYVQFGWLYLGLCGRILFFNGPGPLLAVWMLGTVGAAIAVGYLYAGKSWCQYFCPMATVQRVYAQPMALLSSSAHTSPESITQSMCRTLTPEGQEKSACVACQTPCIDIDAERDYWDWIHHPHQSFLYYSYVGLVAGYFLYYYLYAGNWDYYLSGIWAQDTAQLESIFEPGFYLWGHAIPIPKLVAVPLTLGLFSQLGHLLGQSCERGYQQWLKRRHPPLSMVVIRHRAFSVATLLVFHLYFLFGGRPLVLLLPIPVQIGYQLLLVGVSLLWLKRVWHRTPAGHKAETQTHRRAQKQLASVP